MKESPTRVTLTEPGLAGDYIVAERHADGTVVLAPDTSADAIRRRLGTRPMTPEEFDEHFGHLPVDDEGLSVADSPRFVVRFDEEALIEDLHHASSAGREVALRERERLQRDGVTPAELKRCQPEGRDGTALAGCVKTYLPQPNGPWGMVFAGERDADGGPVLVCLAFGVRHPARPWHPSVYEVAHRRLHRAAGGP